MGLIVGLVILGLFVVGLLLGGFFFYRWYKDRKDKMDGANPALNTSKVLPMGS